MIGAGTGYDRRMRYLMTTVVVWPLLWAGGVATAAAADPQAARALLVDVAETMVGALQAKEVRTDQEQVRALVDRELLPHVDFDRSARLVLGKHWRRASPEQRARFTEEFRGFVVRFYTTAMADYVQDHEVPADLMSFGEVRGSAGSRIIEVPSTLHRPDADDIAVNYRLYHDGEAWKVVDVTVAGISMVTNYRSSFSAEIGQSGLDGLIERLASRNLDLGYDAGAQGSP